MFRIKAPAFPTDLTWLNTTQAWSLDQLRGQVVILDFWTYCCINCIHILPDLAQIETEFAAKPVAVIGVHAAKFDNENDPVHIQSAIDRYQIAHPVVIDSDHSVWDHYAVRAWPTLVVIDAEGYIRWHGSGEGHLAELRTVIQQLLLEGRRKKILSASASFKSQPPKAGSNTLHFPGKICFDDGGHRLFISDSNHHRIIETELSSPTTAQITTIIGQGQPGFRDGPTLTAQFNQPQGMCYHNGYLAVADTGNHALRQIWVGESSASKAGHPPVVTTLAGTGTQADRPHQGGAALRSALNSPWDLVYTPGMLWVAMAGSHQIWRYDFDAQTIVPWAGSGGENLVDGPLTKAQLAQPSGLAWNGHYLFVADSETSSLRAIDPSSNQVHTLIGHGLFEFGLKDGPWAEALLQHPLGVTVAGTSLYVADTYNHAIRQLDLVKETISTLIQTLDHQTCLIGDANCQVLPLYEPNDVKLNGHHLYIADTNNHLIRVFDLHTKELSQFVLK